MFEVDSKHSPSTIKVINPEVESECLIHEVTCLKQSRIKIVIFHLLCILSLGFVWLLTYWSARVSRKLKFQQTQIHEATHFLIKNWDNKSEIVPKMEKDLVLRLGETQKRIAFFSRFVFYYYDPHKEVFSPPLFPLCDRLQQIAKSDTLVYDEVTRKQMLQFYGQNTLSVPVNSKVHLFIQQILSPYEVFQIYAIILWLCEAYYTFPIILLIASIIVYIYNVNILQENQRKLRDDSFIRIHLLTLRCPIDSPTMMLTQSDQLVPGDLFLLPAMCRVPCDCVILLGSVLVNQNYITGNAQPVRKHQLQNMIYESDYANQIKLSMGTEIIQIRQSSSESIKQSSTVGHLPHKSDSVLCMVTRTGYATTRGQYMKNVMFPIPKSFQFKRQSQKVIIFLFLITVCGFLVALQQIKAYQSNWQIFIIFLDLVATSIPPSLPTALSVGIGFAISRLKELEINCNIPDRILVGGQIDTICLEKTGILTKRQMSMIGLVLSDQGVLKEIITKLEPQKLISSSLLCFQAMATCHSVSRLELQDSITYIGSPIDTEIFRFSTGKIQPDQKTIRLLNTDIKIIKCFEFSSAAQQMGVIVSVDQELNGIKLFVKGSTERILPNCKTQSLPQNIYEFINKQALKGYRLIALAAKTLSNQKYDCLVHDNKNEYSLKKLQKDMTFLGLIILQNVLELGSQTTVRQLLYSNFNVIILSGDNQMTTSSVAFGCGLFDNKEAILLNLQTDLNGNKKVNFSQYHGTSPADKMQPSLKQEDIQCTDKIKNRLIQNSSNSQARESEDQFIKEFIFSINELNNEVYGMTGKLFEELFVKRNVPELLKVFNKTVFFSSMMPRHKTELIEFCKKIHKNVAIAGQSIREGSACRQADLSLALTQSQLNELSYSHFSAQTFPSILNLLRVCQAGLSTNYQTFKILCQFSLLEFTTMIILYMNFEELNNTEFLYIDLFIMCPIFITLSMTEPCDRLSRLRPPSSIFSAVNTLSLLGIYLIQLVSQVAMISYLKSQSFYLDRMELKMKNLKDGAGFTEGLMGSSTLFVFSNFLYLGIVVSASIAKPFRKQFYSNLYLVFNVIILWVYSFLIPFSAHLVPDSMDVENIGADWYVLVIVWAHVVCVLMYLYERLLNWLFQNNTLAEKT